MTGGMPSSSCAKHRYTHHQLLPVLESPARPAGQADRHSGRPRKTEEDHQIYKQAIGLDSGQVTSWTSWHRRTAISLLAGAFPAAAAVRQRARDGDAAALGLIPVTISGLLRQLRGTVIPWPRRDKAHRGARTLWRRRRQHRARQAHQRWNAYAGESPQPI
jgi:hypothetical protein